jgi:hypothetical protein
MKGRRSWLWAQGLGCGVLVASAAPLALVLGVALAPVGLCAAGGAGALARILAVYAGAALAPWGWELWAVARDWPAAMDLLAEARLPGMAWAAQGAGWLLSQAAPMVARLVMETRVKARIARLRDARTRLAAEWGLDA